MVDPFLVGWVMGGGDPIALFVMSALPLIALCILLGLIYVAIFIALTLPCFIGAMVVYLIQWKSWGRSNVCIVVLCAAVAFVQYHHFYYVQEVISRFFFN